MTSRIFSYKYNFQNPLVKGNDEQWISIGVNNANTTTRFSSAGNSELVYNFASNSQFLRAHTMFKVCTLTPRNAAGMPITGTDAAGIRNSKLGGAAAFTKQIVRTGSETLETLDIAERVGEHYATLPEVKRGWLKDFEGFEDTQMFVNGPRKIAQRIWSTFFSQTTALPLPVFTGGVQLVETVAPVENLITTNNVDSFSVDDAYIRVLALTPDPSITLALTSSVRSGGSLFIPAEETRVFRSYGLGGDTMLINCPMGQYSSVNSVITRFYNASARANRANDKYLINHDAGLRKWSITANDVVNPRDRPFTTGPNDPEGLMVTMLSEVGSVHNLDDIWFRNVPGDSFFQNHFYFGLNYQSDDETHGSGLSMVGAADGSIKIDCQFAAPVTSDVIAVTTVTCAILLEVTGSFVHKWKDF